jgi:hypothetical protein
MQVLLVVRICDAHRDQHFAFRFMVRLSRALSASLTIPMFGEE